MSARAFDAGAVEDALPAAELDRLQATIAQRLRRVGVHLPDAEVAALAEALFADAVRVCLDWVEGD